MCIFLRARPNAGISPGRASCLSRRRVSHVARCTRRVHVVPDVPLTLNKRKRARELLSQHIFGHNSMAL